MERKTKMTTYYPQGTHKAEITNQGFVSGQYGWQFILIIRPVDGEHNRTVYLSLINEDGDRHEYADKSIEVLRYLGFQGEDTDLGRLDPEQSNHHSFVGISVEAYCKHKTKENGDTIEQWYINTPRAGAVVQSLDKAALRKLNTLFGKALKVKDESATPNSPAVPATTAPVGITPEEAAAEGETEDDIPF
jgi:hypothetical protein